MGFLKYLLTPECLFLFQSESVTPLPQTASSLGAACVWCGAGSSLVATLSRLLPTRWTPPPPGSGSVVSLLCTCVSHFPWPGENPPRGFPLLLHLFHVSAQITLGHGGLPGALSKASPQPTSASVPVGPLTGVSQGTLSRPPLCCAVPAPCEQGLCFAHYAPAVPEAWHVSVKCKLDEGREKGAVASLGGEGPASGLFIGRSLTFSLSRSFIWVSCLNHGVLAASVLGIDWEKVFYLILLDAAK